MALSAPRGLAEVMVVLIAVLTVQLPHVVPHDKTRDFASVPSARVLETVNDRTHCLQVHQTGIATCRWPDIAVQPGSSFVEVDSRSTIASAES